MIDYEILKKCALFTGMSDDEIHNVVTSLDGNIRKAEKNTVLINQGDETYNISIILSGSVLAYQEDFTGGFRHVIVELGRDDMISSSSPILHVPHPLTLVAREDTVYFSFSANKLLSRNAVESNNLNHFGINLLIRVSQSMSLLFKKLTVLTQRTTRARLLGYLVQKSYEAGSETFTITLNRQQLADSLGADRAAMTVVLYELMNDGYIIFNNNEFTLTEKAYEEV